MRLLLFVMVLIPAVALAQPAPPPGLLVEEAVVQADSSATVWINGLEVELAVSTGTVDHVTLNAAAVARIGLSAAPADNKADLFIGGVQQRVGRHGAGWLAAGGRLQRQQLYWFPGAEVLPLAGTIGPFALPHDRVRVEWQAGDATPYAFALIGNVDRAAYGVADLAGRPYLVGADVRMRRPLPLVTAALGADLAERLGGTFVGEPWPEEIMLGISRPVRRLELTRPLVIGPLRFSAVAVRVGGPRDATMSLARGQVTPLDAEEDPEAIQVRGRIIRQRQVARYIMLSRTQLEAHGCISLTVAKSARQFILECAPPERPPSTTGQVQATVPVAVAASATGMIEPVLPPEAETALTLSEPLDVVIEGQSLRLALGEAGREGLRLNGRASARVRVGGLGWQGGDEVALNQFLEALRQAPPTALGAPGALPMAGGVPVRASVQAVEVAYKTDMLSQEVTLANAGRQTRTLVTWLESRRLDSGAMLKDSAPFDGMVALAALPGSRFRLRLGAGSGTDGETLALAIADRSHDQGVMGVTALPGIEALFIGLEFGRGLDQAVASMALGQDLVRLHGGRLTGPEVRVWTADYRRRTFRRLVLATPLVVGPLRLESVLVEHADGLPEWLTRRKYAKDQPLPDMKGIAGLERELRLPVPMLRAVGCGELVVDKPGRAWTLRCRAVSAPPAPSDLRADRALRGG